MLTNLVLTSLEYLYLYNNCLVSILFPFAIIYDVQLVRNSPGTL